MRSKRIGHDIVNPGRVERLWLNTACGFAFRMQRFFSLVHCSSLVLCLLVAGCVSTPRNAPMRAASMEPQTEVEKSGVPSESAPQPAVHIVQKGDTLYSIALNHGINQKDLAEWNNIPDTSAIHIGQQLYLSSPSQPDGPLLFPVSEPTPPAVAEMTLAPPSLSEARPLPNTDRLKTEPKAFKLPYSEFALAQLATLAVKPSTVIVKAEPAMEKNTAAELPVMPAPAAEAAPDIDHVEWIWPTRGKILGGFSEATKGIDIAGESGQSVIASAAGKVVYSGAGLRGYGRLIIIKHNNTYLSAYAHNSKILVKEGQTVAKGQKIAEMGNTDTDLVKLHFEIRKNGKPIDPLEHLPGISG